MSNNNDDIIGRIKYEVLEELFKMGDLSHPDTILKEITDAMDKFNALEKENFNKGVSLKSLLSFSKKHPCYYNKFKRPLDFIRAIKEGEIKHVSSICSDDYLVDLWYKISDVRKVLHVKCVAKNSQSNNVMAGKNTLLALNRVLKNKKEYLEL